MYASGAGVPKDSTRSCPFNPQPIPPLSPQPLGFNQLDFDSRSLTRYHAIHNDVAAERPFAIAANRWARRFK
jgi:hypothetical protein